jgi:hypothetical protein
LLIPVVCELIGFHLGRNQLIDNLVAVSFGVLAEVKDVSLFFGLVHWL